MSSLAKPSRPTSAPADLLAPIAHDLDEVERVLARSLASERPFVAELVAHLSHYRGKRLRPTLLLLTARACGQLTPAHHVLGAVVEMVHTATLVHDDVLDSAAVRRHVPTVNARWDNTTSVLLGDCLFTRAFHLASTVDVRACRLIGEATNRVCEGELQQGGEKGNLELSEADYLDIIDGKTAELTSCCCRLGALFADAEPDVVERLADYGRALGMAFQIADDVLDLTGEERTAGKSLGTDVEQQKLTLPLIRLLATAPPDRAEKVRQLLRTPGSARHPALRAALTEGDALDYTYQRARAFAAEAAAQLHGLPHSTCRTILEALPQRVVYRNR